MSVPALERKALLGRQIMSRRLNRPPAHGGPFCPSCRRPSRLRSNGHNAATIMNERIVLVVPADHHYATAEGNITDGHVNLES